MTSGERGSELIFLEKKDTFLVCVQVLIIFSISLSRGRIARTFLLCPLWSCLCLAHMMCEGFWEEAGGKCF